MQAYMCLCICAYTYFLKNLSLTVTKLSFRIFEANLKNTFIFFLAPCAELSVPTNEQKSSCFIF